MSIQSLIETIKKDGILRASGVLEELYKLATENESQLTALTSQLESVVAENSGLRHLLYKIGETGNANFGRTSLPTPATDAFLAEVRASGVEMFAGEIGDYAKGKSPATAEIIKATGRNALRFAAQLRQGGAS